MKRCEGCWCVLTEQTIGGYQDEYFSFSQPRRMYYCKRCIKHQRETLDTNDALALLILGVPVALCAVALLVAFVSGSLLPH